VYAIGLHTGIVTGTVQPALFSRIRIVSLHFSYSYNSTQQRITDEGVKHV